jgi:penicillin-binding protein 1A
VHAALTNGATGANAGQAGLVLMDVDGAIRALVGGRSYAESQFNRALKARRQPGSAFKMFVYLAALDSGCCRQRGAGSADPGFRMEPRNEGGVYRGAVSLRNALALSMNTPRRANMMVGPRRPAAVALGIQSDCARRARSRLASGDAAGADRCLRRAGQRRPLGGAAHHQSRAHRFRPGDLRARGDDTKVLVAPAQIRCAERHAQCRAGDGHGPARGMPRHPAAGKTGTSQDFRDAWFLGYTHFVAAYGSAMTMAGRWTGDGWHSARPSRE